MKENFWSKLKKQALKRAPGEPIMVLAPMADVTDAAFRRIIAKYGKPDAMWTEFVSADGLCHPEGRKKLLVDLSYSETERPIIAQLFSGRPEKMFEAAKLVKELGFDGLDINMGCPDRSIEKSGAGAALMKNPKLAREIIRAAKEGVGDLPVSVKTRIGYNKNELATWLPELLSEEPAMITIHARTRKEMSEVPARWEEVRRAVEIRDSLKSQTLIFGNGDVTDLEDARALARASGADGVMLGRAIFGNPFLFSELVEQKKSEKSGEQVQSVETRLLVMLEHTKLFDQLFCLNRSEGTVGRTGLSDKSVLGGIKNFAVMKKHYKAYVNDWDGAKELRIKLMEAETVGEIETIVKQYLATI